MKTFEAVRVLREVSITAVNVLLNRPVTNTILLSASTFSLLALSRRCLTFWELFKPLKTCSHFQSSTRFTLLDLFRSSPTYFPFSLLALAAFLLLQKN